MIQPIIYDLLNGKKNEQRKNVQVKVTLSHSNS